MKLALAATFAVAILSACGTVGQSAVPQSPALAIPQQSHPTQMRPMQSHPTEMVLRRGQHGDTAGQLP